MPYRALLTTLVTVTLALLAVGMWVRAVSPLLSEARAATRPAPITTAQSAPASEYPSNPAHDTRALNTVIKGTLLLSFILICLLLIVGLFATFREWVRVRTIDKPTPLAKKTPFVDAWKLAGERVKMEGGDEKKGEAEP